MRVFWRTLAALGVRCCCCSSRSRIAVRSVDVKEFVGPLQQRVEGAPAAISRCTAASQLQLGLEPKLVLDDVTLSNASWASSRRCYRPDTSRRADRAAAAAAQALRGGPLQAHRTNHRPGDRCRRKGNWEFPALPAAAQGSTPAPSGGILGGLLVNDMAISDGTATYRDGKTGEITTIVIDDLSVHARDPQSPISGSFRGKVNGHGGGARG